MLYFIKVIKCTDKTISVLVELGVIKMNIVGFDKPTIDKSLALSEKYDQLYSTIGWHPTEAGSYSQEIEDRIVSQLDNPKVVALGEIGLDYYWMEDPKELSLFTHYIPSILPMIRWNPKFSFPSSGE